MREMLLFCVTAVVMMCISILGWAALGWVLIKVVQASGVLG